jgi:ABC-type multidrug transport system permease subunit
VSSLRSHPLVELTWARLKEFLREPEAIFWVFVFPILLALALGIAFRGGGPERLKVAVEETDGAVELVAALAAGEALDPRVLPAEEAQNRLRTGKVALVIVPGDPVVFVFDSARSESRLARLLVEDAIQDAAGRRDPREIRERRVTEPGSRYIDFLIPGLLGMNLMGSGMWGVGFAIVQARTRRLLKRLMATPMRKSHYLMSFAFSRLVFLVIEAVALVGFGWLVFDVRVYGSLLDLAIVALTGALAFAGLGLLTAARAKTVEGVSGLINLVMLPMWVLSGVFFSYAYFPDAFQPVIQALPLTQLNDALRAVMIDGAGLASTWPALAVVAAWGGGSFLVALRIFRWR